MEVYDAIKRLRTGQPIALDFYRSKQQKMELLDEALQCLQRDVIVTVIFSWHYFFQFLGAIIFEKNSIEFSVPWNFTTETGGGWVLRVVPERNVWCWRAYGYPLVGDFSGYSRQFFSAMGKTDEAAMVEFAVASKKRQPEARIQALKKCLISGLSDPTLSNEAKFVEEYINLLEWQIPIDVSSW